MDKNFAKYTPKNQCAGNIFKLSIQVAIFAIKNLIYFFRFTHLLYIEHWFIPTRSISYLPVHVHYLSIPLS